MGYAEKRDGKLTGRYISEFRGRFPKRAFNSKKDSDGYEAYVKATGEEPANIDATGTVSGRTFKSVAKELEDAGGPEGTWAKGRDPSVLSRLRFICGLSFGSLPIEQVTYGEVEKVVADLAKRPGHAKGTKLTDATINRYLSPISSVLTYASMKEDPATRKPYIPSPPKLPWRKEAKRRQATYSHTMEQAVVGALRAAGHDVDAFLFEVLAISGMRVGELLGLRPEQIEDGFVSLDDPEDIKNGYLRELYIGEKNADRLRVLIRENKLPTYQQLYIHVQSAVEKCGYDVKRPLHAIRHTTATRTVAAEHDIQVAQQLLGHKSIKTTQGYRHVSKGVLRERAKKLHPHLGETQEAPQVLPFVPAANALK